VTAAAEFSVENISANSTPKNDVIVTAYAERLLAKKNSRLTCYIADHPLVRFELGFYSPVLLYVGAYIDLSSLNLNSAF
jgi:hypothetical protein